MNSRINKLSWKEIGSRFAGCLWSAGTNNKLGRYIGDKFNFKTNIQTV